MSPLANITILIAEDERPVRMLLRVILEAAGAKVLEAEDGARALQLFDLTPNIDLVCTDVNMPNIDGLELTKLLKNREPNLPIVVCTALDLNGHASELKIIADKRIHKPFNPAELVRTISEAITASKLLGKAAVS